MLRFIDFLERMERLLLCSGLSDSQGERSQQERFTFQKSNFEPLRKLAGMVVKSSGMTRPLDVKANQVLRELKTGKSILILNCDAGTIFLYWPPSLKLEGTLGYTYCSGASLGVFLHGWAAPKNAEPIYKIIYGELSKRSGRPSNF